MSKTTTQEPTMTDITYPAVARYVSHGVASNRSILIEKPEHIGIALHRLAGIDSMSMGPRDYLEILTSDQTKVQARLFGADLESVIA